jgi:hypothetical protein
MVAGTYNMVAGPAARAEGRVNRKQINRRKRRERRNKGAEGATGGRSSAVLGMQIVSLTFMRVGGL